MFRWSFLFTFAAMNIELTRDNLDYIAFVALEFCNLCGNGCDEYIIETATNKFYHRVDQIDCASNYELYKSTNSIQHRIKDHNIDPDKFWLLLLFLKDYTESCFGESMVFDKMSVGKNVMNMLEMLNSGVCKMTISSNTKSAQISTLFIKEELKELLQNLREKETEIDNIYPYTETTEDNVQWHKNKFFIDMLDYFLSNHTANNGSGKSGRKDWILIAQSLYLVDYLKEEKYLNGYDIVTQKRTDIDGNVSIVRNKVQLKGLGKYFTDNTKHLADTSKRRKSLYCFQIPVD